MPDEKPTYLNEALELYRSGEWQPDDDASPFYEYTTSADEDLATANRERRAQGQDPLTELPKPKLVPSRSERESMERAKAKKAQEQAAADRQQQLDALTIPESLVDWSEERPTFDQAHTDAALELASVVDTETIRAQVEEFRNLDDDALLTAAREAQAEATRVAADRVDTSGWSPDQDAIALHDKALNTALGRVGVIAAEQRRREAEQLLAEHDARQVPDQPTHMPAYSSTTASIPAGGWNGNSAVDPNAELKELTILADEGDLDAQRAVRKQLIDMGVPPDKLPGLWGTTADGDQMISDTESEADYLASFDTPRAMQQSRELGRD